MVRRFALSSFWAVVVFAATASAQSPWKTYGLSSLRLSISLPAKPNERKMRLKENIDTVATSNWYTMQAGEFTATLNYSTYRPGFPANASGAAQGALAGLKQSKPNVKFTTNMKTVTIGGVSGFKTYATFQDVEGRVVYESLTLGKGLRLWQVIFTYSASPNNAAMAKKALASVKLRP